MSDYIVSPRGPATTVEERAGRIYAHVPDDFTLDQAGPRAFLVTCFHPLHARKGGMCRCGFAGNQWGWASWTRQALAEPPEWTGIERA